MGSTEWLSIPISQLELGLPLRYDIFSDAGDHLAAAGDEFGQSLKASWIQLGIDSVFGKVTHPIEDEELLQPYDQSAIKYLLENLEMAADIIMEVASKRNEKPTVTNMEFEELSNQMLQCIQVDAAVALQTVASSIRAAQDENDRALAERSSRLSLLSMAIAFEMGLVPSECFIIGIAAMLHDISLMGMSDMVVGEDGQELYRQHPIMSNNIADSIIGINPKVGMTIAQVHESPAGDGFPRGLRANRIMETARVINLADTFLTLTSSKQPLVLPTGRNFHPADAMGYLMFHAAQGQFEISAVKALIRAASLYPVGSRVQLSDQSIATVYRSSRTTPTKPIVRLESSQSLVDLRHFEHSILGPERVDQGYRVLPKSQLGEVFWG